MNGIIYGYARVSAKDQNEARQLIALKTFGICQMSIPRQIEHRHRAN